MVMDSVQIEDDNVVLTVSSEYIFENSGFLSFRGQRGIHIHMGSNCDGLFSKA